jgi:uncharacterized lipoprotein NlpE involved in copper resistance
MLGPLLLVLALVIGCCSSQRSLPAGHFESTQHASRTRIPREDPSQQLLGTYIGTLPCADCQGIRTELSLYIKGPNQFAEATYKLKEIYLGTRDGDRAVESVGYWTVLRGNRADSNATIYQLNYDQPRDVSNFLRVSDEELRLLDRQQHEIESRANLSLRRRQSSLVGGYAPVDAADDRVRAAADFAVADEAQRLDQIIRLEAIVHAETADRYRYKLPTLFEDVRQRGIAIREALVYQNLKGQYSLTSWTGGHC